jgi:N-methylhydantoinase B
LTVLAGGTDFYPAQTARTAWLEATPRNILDISGIEELRGIREGGSGITFGALTTWAEIRDARLPRALDGLKLAAREVGGQQVQNRGTIAGNLCNASPAADGVPPLLTLDASVEIVSVRGRRSVPMAEFITGNRKTVLAADELVTAVHVPTPDPAARATFLKLGARAYLVISIVSAATAVQVGDDGCIARARIAIGACSAVPQRLMQLEQDLTGAPAAEAIRIVMAGHMAALHPIDDVRGSADYRRRAALVVTRRALMQCLAIGSEAAA